MMVWLTVSLISTFVLIFAYIVHTSFPWIISPFSFQAEMAAETNTPSTVYDFTVNDIRGNHVSLDIYRGHVLIIVNVASQCGLSNSNMKGLVELHKKFGQSKGLKILAFPCNQFANQEPGNSEEIVCYMKEKNVDFDYFEKIDVNGDNAHPLYKFLKSKIGGLLGSSIKWNFTKYIIDKNGVPVERHGPMTSPEKLVASLEKYW